MSTTLSRRWIPAIVLVLASTAPGCALQWHDVPGAVLDPVVVDPAANDEADWRSDVAGAAAEWGDALAAVGCERPFLMDGEDGHTVALVPTAAWDNGEHCNGETWGEGHGENIEIRADADAHHHHRPVLLHELGHALGLWHSRKAFGPSVMTPASSSPHLTDRDVAAAACVLGCGPCDPAADPYQD